MAYPASFRADLKRTEIWKKRKKLEEKSPCEQFKMVNKYNNIYQHC